MITCERCKTENLDGSQYCDECGAPLRPNFRSNPAGAGGSKAEADGQNGSHSPAIKQPEFASGSHSGVNFASSPGSETRLHAWLVIERGRSLGKKFMLGTVESQIGAGMPMEASFPTLTSTLMTRKRRYRGVMPGLRFAREAIFWKTWDRPTERL